ncbi:glycosyltransferase family 10 [Acidimicrobiia bacterium]|nr:glycosyltransferase family 10 [Acidimicrobiia bacterium]
MDKLLNIKLTTNDGSKNSDIYEFVGNNESEFNGCKFWINSEHKEADVWFVIEDLNNHLMNTNIERARTIFLSSETSWYEDYFTKKHKKNFLDQFGRIYSCYETGRRQFYDIPFLTWMINNNHIKTREVENFRDINYFMKLNHLEKSKKLSIICSTKSFTDGHKKRLDFVYKLKEHFQEDLDWFGNGINPIQSKWEGIAPYKYHIAIENKINKHIISEKLYDSYLGLSMPIYSGSSNVNKYFSDKSVIKIDINNLKKSIEIIEKAFSEKLFEKNYKFIVESKNKVCKELNLFYRLSVIAKEIDKNEPKGTKKKLTIKNKNYFEERHIKIDNSKKLIINFLKKIFKR